MARHLTVIPVLGVLLLSLPGVAGAQMLADPMRPPLEFMPAVATGASATLPSAQVVILGEGRRQVTLNGQTLREGDRVGDLKVETFTDNEVVLRANGSARERISLYPGITKTPSVAKIKPLHGPGTGKTEGKK